MVATDSRMPSADSRLLADPDQFKLALFCPNTARGTTMSTARDGLVKATWDEQIRLCQAADRAGIEAVIPLAKWRNTPRVSREADRVFDTFTWASAIAAVTERIQVFATFHVPLYPPVMAAKMIATIDHVSGGRFGVNVVAGFSPTDFRMFGIELDPARDRYGVMEEWVSLVKRILSEPEPFDHRGTIYHGEGIVSEPKPLQSPWPPIMCAGGSQEGKAFSVRHADLNFAGFPNFEAIPEMVAEMRLLAAQVNRPIKLFTHCYVICGETEPEAQARLEHFVGEHLDEPTARAFMDATLGYSKSTAMFADSLAEQGFMSRVATGFLALPLVGTAQQIVARIRELAGAGLDGIAISFPDYDEGIRAYGERLRPLLIDCGLRRA
jgi:FMNH2-dependent dimethyl sulfone monooxygenase